jgi:hypothetical protein
VEDNQHIGQFPTVKATASILNCFGQPIATLSVVGAGFSRHGLG